MEIKSKWEDEPTLEEILNSIKDLIGISPLLKNRITNKKLATEEYFNIIKRG